MMRRDCIKTLAILLIQLILHEGILITNIPPQIKYRLRNILPEMQPPPVSNPPASSRKVRCGLCNWKKDRKTKIACTKCNVPI